MFHYFNTPDQIKGDTAFNEGRLAVALDHYKSALETLNRRAAVRSFVRDTSYKDALAYVLKEIIVTTVMLMCSDENKASSEELYQSSLAHISEFNAVYKELEGKTRTYTTEDAHKEVLNALKQLSTQCENNSNFILQQIEITPLGQMDLHYFDDALEWLSRARSCLKKANVETPISLYLSALYILEFIYKKEKTEESLKDIERVIKKHFTDKPEHMAKINADGKLELELLSYQLLIAIQRKSSNILDLSARASSLMKNVQLDPESVLVHSLNLLIAEADQLLPPSHRLKRRRILSDSDQGAPSSFMMPGVSQTSSPERRQRIENSMTFFGSAIAKNTNVIDAFLAQTKKLTSGYTNSKFSAILLSLIGDFYFDYKNSSNSKQPAMAYILYKAALKLEPEHKIATHRLNKLTMHFTMAQEDNSSSMQLKSQIFEEAVRTVLNTDLNQLNDLIDSVAGAIRNQKLAKESSDKIASDLESAKQSTATPAAMCL